MSKLLFLIVASIGFLAVLFLYLAGIGYQQGSMELGEAFGLMRYCAYAGLVSIALVVIYILWQRPGGLKFVVLTLSAVAGFTAFYLPYQQQEIASSVPPIHDISTDTVNPPAFIAIAPLRADAPNPVEYAGAETAAQQIAAYPEIVTTYFKQDPEVVFAIARAEIIDLGWDLVDANADEGRIEATVTTRWFGFKDDVVLRLSAGEEAGTLLDMRSKSRVGRSDVGVNAARIKAFIQMLNSQFGNS